MPAIDSRATRAASTMAMATTPMNTVPWTCDAADRGARADCSARIARHPVRRARRSGRTGGWARRPGPVRSGPTCRPATPRARPKGRQAGVRRGHPVDGATNDDHQRSPPPRGRRRRRSTARARRPVRTGLPPVAPRSPAERRPTACRGSTPRPASRPGTRRGPSGPPAASPTPRATPGTAAGCCSKLSSNADQPSPIRPASRAPAAVSPPMMIGGGGSGTGNATASLNG